MYLATFIAIYFYWTYLKATDNKVSSISKMHQMKVSVLYDAVVLT